MKLTFLLKNPFFFRYQLLLIFFSMSTSSLPYGRLFEDSELISSPAARVITDPAVLRKAAHDALAYFRGNRKLVCSSLLKAKGLCRVAAEKTLKKIVSLIDEDFGKSAYRVADPEFLKNNFNFIKWTGDETAAKENKVVIPVWPDGGKLKDGRIKITSYAVFSVDGDYSKSEEHSVPICGLSRLKRHGKAKGAPRIVHDLAGKKNSIHPLVWLTKKAADDALMQGSVIVSMPDGLQRTFNVHKRLDVELASGLKNNESAWLFKEIFDIEGTKGGPHLKILNHGGALFAGDLRQLGLGKIIALKYKNPISGQEEIRLGVLADTGEAFKNNLYQLDIYAGIFKSRQKFKQHLKRLPNTAHAYLMVAK